MDNSTVHRPKKQAFDKLSRLLMTLLVVVSIYLLAYVGKLTPLVLAGVFGALAWHNGRPLYAVQKALQKVFSSEG